jgi:aspartate/methionine/tyrosine aminotransferase
MPLPVLSHLSWSKAEVPRHRFNLAESAISAPDLEAMGLPHRGGLPATGYRLMETLERSLGERIGAPGSQVLITAGGSEANACVFGALLEPGQEVLVETPGYEPHREVPGIFGLPVRGFARPLEAGGRGLADAVEAALSPATRMVVISHLHNPSGLALAEADAAALDRLAASRGLWLLCDEIFRDATTAPLGTFASLSPRWISTGSLTKIYGLGGLRIGWIAGSTEMRSRCAALQNALSVLPALPSVSLALELWPHLDALRARAHRILAENHARWAEFLGNGAAMRCPAQSLGTTAWCRFAGPSEGDAFSDFASQRFDLAVAPGRFFGEPAGFRVALGGEPASFRAALEVLNQAGREFGTATADSRHAVTERP